MRSRAWQRWRFLALVSCFGLLSCSEYHRTKWIPIAGAEALVEYVAGRWVDTYDGQVTVEVRRGDPAMLGVRLPDHVEIADARIQVDGLRFELEEEKSITTWLFWRAVSDGEDLVILQPEAGGPCHSSFVYARYAFWSVQTQRVGRWAEAAKDEFSDWLVEQL